MELYGFQKQSIAELEEPDKHIVVQPVGSGKTAVMFNWLKNQARPKVLIITTASKRDSGDMEKEADVWCGEEWRTSLSSFVVLSWAGLAKWWQQNRFAFEPSEWAIALDEVQSGKAGVSSQRGKAFLQIAAQTDCWTGYTATAGDKWIDFYAYFTATHKVRNKTEFTRKFCNVQTFKGFPEIVGYFHTDVLEDWWNDISVRPDASVMYKEIPPETHKVITLSKPREYATVLKTRMYNGKMLDTTMGLCMTLRQICFTKEKKQWIADFLEGLGTNAVFFHNFIEEGEEIVKIAKKVLPKGAKVWLINGKTHEIPTKETIGKHDIIVANYGAGAEGLNLQFVNYWVSVDYNYSYTKSTQARGRIRRIGQTRPQFYYYLETKGTIEQDIKRCLSNKSDFAETTWAAQLEGENNEE